MEKSDSIGQAPTVVKNVLPLDLAAVSNAYMRDYSSELDRARLIIQENPEFWLAFEEEVTRLDPENANAMMRGAVLMLSSLKRRGDIEALRRLF
jgi:hypothetical protein